MLTNKIMTGVPGWLKGWFYALEKYGTMSFAEDGYKWTFAQNNALMGGNNFAELASMNGDGKHVPYFEDGLPIQPGSIIEHEELAAAI